MPCNHDKVDMNAPEEVPPSTPPKATGNGGAGRVDPDGQMIPDSEDSDEQQSAMSKRKWNSRESWTMIKRWVTGEKLRWTKMILIESYSNLHVTGWKRRS